MGNGLHSFPGDRGRKEESVLPSLEGRVQDRALAFTGCVLEQGSDFSGPVFRFK